MSTFDDELEKCSFEIRRQGNLARVSVVYNGKWDGSFIENKLVHKLEIADPEVITCVTCEEHFGKSTTLCPYLIRLMQWLRETRQAKRGVAK